MPKQRVVIAYDTSYQGESTGELRSLENPYLRVENISAVRDFKYIALRG